MVSFTRDTFHNSQILLSDKVIRYASWSSHAIFGSAIAVCVSTFIPSHISQKLINVAIAPVLFAVSNRLDRLAMYASGYGSISEAQSHKGYAQWLDASLQPPRREVAIAQPTIIEPTAPVKYAPIESSLKKPHLMILGETGSGKSTICKYLVSQVNAPCLIIDPHASPTDWRGFTVTGSGRNYEAIATEFERLANLMQIRYEARDKGISQFDPLIVIIDEFPAIASSLGKGATDTVKLLAREARKVSIRMCLLSQGAEVKTLGLEGEGSIRECFAMLRLGNFALTHGKQSKDKAIGEALENSDRPAMLDQLPCNLPILSDAQTMPVLPLPQDYLKLVDDNAIAPPSSAMQTQSQSTAIAPVFQKIVNYLDGKDWKKDYEIKASIREFKDADTPLTELQGYLQFLETQNLLETRSTQRGSLEARTIRDKTA
jgi:ABC-type dipeptide/oligopeptide/nickel transport system ATPase component